MRRTRKPIGIGPAAVVIAIALSWTTGPASAQTDVIAPERHALTVDGHVLELPYYARPAFDEVTPQYTRALIMVHGTLRNADVYHDLATEATDRADAGEDTVVISPQFLMEVDLDEHQPGDRVLYFTNAGWKRGDRSLNQSGHPRPARISSYAALETLLEILPEKVENLEHIIVAGHSAGGQYVNRFAASNRVHDFLAARGIRVHYIISNPSSYMYFCDHRVVDGSPDEFAPVSDEVRESCTDFNRYKYGPDELNRHMRAVDIDRLGAQYAAREVVYLLGADDNDPESRYLDRRCQAMLQGPHRLARGRTYWRYVAFRFGEEVHQRHRKIIVPGVGHNARGMFTHPLGREAIFDFSAAKGPPN